MSDTAPRSRARSHRGGRRWVRLGGRTLLSVVALLSLVVAFTAVSAARTSGNEDFKAKWADWLRAHHGAVVVDRLEAIYFARNAPKKGGQLKALDRLPPPASVRSVPFAGVRGHTPNVRTGVGPAIVPVPTVVPTDIALVVLPGVAGEGHWTPTGLLVNGQPGLYVAQFRADAVFTSQITKAVWMNPKLVRLSLVPGAKEPGGSWPQLPYIADDQLPSVVAAFNGGFRFQDAKGGFFLDGREAVPLRPDAASVVIFDDGRIDVGAWGRDDHLGPGVKAVLQNLTLLVDGGRIDPLINRNDTHAWGATLKGSTAVARSGVGVTAGGQLVYVEGPALTAQTLAESLQRAGAVRAMTLDINPYWVTFNLFTHPDPAHPGTVVAAKLEPSQKRPASRYLGPTKESRDFFTVSVR